MADSPRSLSTKDPPGPPAALKGPHRMGEHVQSAQATSRQCGSHENEDMWKLQ